MPWLGYFDQLDRAEVFVHYDDVQYDKGGWRNRNRVKTTSGLSWLSVPVSLSGKFGATAQNYLKKATGSRMHKITAIFGIWVIGCRTAVIDENDANLAEVHEPFNETGFWLAPIITGWGTVVSAPKAWARKFL